MVLPAGGLAVWGRASLLTGSGVLRPGLLIIPSPIGEDRLAAGAIRNRQMKGPPLSLDAINCRPRVRHEDPPQRSARFGRDCDPDRPGGNCRAEWPYRQWVVDWRPNHGWLSGRPRRLPLPALLSANSASNRRYSGRPPKDVISPRGGEALGRPAKVH